jgi:natural product precursor
VAQKINLALLNKKKEELVQSEMKEIRGGMDCDCIYDPLNEFIDNSEIDMHYCECGSIWMYFGMDY